MIYRNPPLPVKRSFASFDWPKYAWRIPVGTPKSRLEKTRLHRPCCGEYQLNCVLLTADTQERSFYLGSDFMPGLRWEWADVICPRTIRHKGWFCDEDGFGDTMRGLVFRLPHGRGFLPAWSMGEGMCGAVDYSQVYNTDTDAALAADSWAERVAEDGRAFQAKERAEAEALEAVHEESLANDAACRDIATV